jgi:hypothetical protein
MLGCFLLLRDRTQNIAGTGNMRQVDLGLDLVFDMSGTRRLRRCRPCLRMSAQMLADQFRLVLLQRAGVRFLLGNTHHWQNVKNRLALDFQFPGQIVDSNLTHPLSRFLCLSRYDRISNLTDSVCIVPSLVHSSRECAIKPPTSRTSNPRSGRKSGIAIR